MGLGFPKHKRSLAAESLPWLQQSLHDCGPDKLLPGLRLSLLIYIPHPPRLVRVLDCLFARHYSGFAGLTAQAGPAFFGIETSLPGQKGMPNQQPCTAYWPGLQLPRPRETGYVVLRPNPVDAKLVKL